MTKVKFRHCCELSDKLGGFDALTDMLRDLKFCPWCGVKLDEK